MNGWAEFDGEYRYSLGRGWGWGERLVWVMLNPSTADDVEDDPTLRRCIGFTQRQTVGGPEFKSLEVVNLFGLIATRPAKLRDHSDPVGPDNRRYVEEALSSVGFAVAAWGASIEMVPKGVDERAFFMDTAADKGVTVVDLGITKAGHPRHPLYLRKDTPWAIGGL